MNTQPIVLERTLNAPIGLVWDALTDPDKMRVWYFDTEGFAAKTGTEFRFSGCGSDGTPYLHLCEVTEVVAGSKIAYTWRYDGMPGDSLVTFELFAEGDNTRLKLTHAGVESFGANGADFALGSFMGGWNDILDRALVEYLKPLTNKGEPKI